MTKTERLDAILSDAVRDEAEKLGEINESCDHFAELLMACASLPNRQDGYADWARAKAKKLRKLSRQIVEVLEDRWRER
jgi:3-methyladenine DNA glycosylase Tag